MTISNTGLTPLFKRVLALALIAIAATAPNLSAQFQPPGSLGALAPANIAKPRPQPPFNLTGTWLHGGGPDNAFSFSPPAGFKLTPAAQVHYDAARKAQAEGKVYRDDIGQCWPSGLPIMMTRVWPIAMIQLPTMVLMIQELMNTMRFIYLDGRTHTDPDVAVPSFNGESIGRWEGDTLVVDTRNFVNDHHWIDRGIPATDALRIVERIRMINDGKTLEIAFTATDPKSWEGEWKWTKRWQRVDERDIAEVSCLPELNQHMPTTHSDANVRK
jgi:hypothetical protein